MLNVNIDKKWQCLVNVKCDEDMTDDRNEIDSDFETILQKQQASAPKYSVIVFCYIFHTQNTNK